MTRDEWLAKGKELFGDDYMTWKFKCPACGHVASTQDYKDAGASSNVVGFSCVGRWDGHMKVDMGTKPGPCNYAGGGLLNLNPVEVVCDGKTTMAFAFAEEERTH